jgi:hypothetical protein
MKIFLYIILFYSGLIIAQNPCYTDENNKITFEKAQFNKPLFGLISMRYEKYKGFNNETEKLYWLTVTVKIENLSDQQNFDFNSNDISLVDSLNLLRHRPRLITGNSFRSGIFSDGLGIIVSVKLENSLCEDHFLKYSQKGIRDYDHYILGKSILDFKGEKANRYRFGHATFYKKQGKDIMLYMIFPTRAKKSGNFSLYYKDQLIKNFLL